MSDINSLNDPELDDLARRLGEVKLSPAARQREQFLFRCGQAAGRDEMGRRLRTMHVASASLACVSAALAFLLVTGDPLAPVGSDPQVRTVAEGSVRNLPVNPERQDRITPPSDPQPQLTVGTSYEQMLSLSRSPSSELGHAGIAELTSVSVLTPVSIPPLDDLWN